MDQRLLTWGRQVKQRKRSKLPTLWLFTDADLLPDPLPSIAKLPRYIAGVVFRHDGTPDRAALGRKIRLLCKARGVALVVAGDGHLAANLKAGTHLRGGRWPDHIRRRELMTSSAHNTADILRARRAGADIIFISPVFLTSSHPGSTTLGNLRWNRLASLTPPSNAYALGGMNGNKAKRLADYCCGAAGIVSLF